jgi:hypothetical protein
MGSSARARHRQILTWWRACCGCTTCKAVIVDGVDDFLYFGTVMLLKVERKKKVWAKEARSWDGRTFKHPGSRQPFWWKMLYSHLFELQSMIATTKWRWKCCKINGKGKTLQSRLWQGGEVAKGSERDEHRSGPSAFLHCAYAVSGDEGTRVDIERDVRYASTHW